MKVTPLTQNSFSNLTKTEKVVMVMSSGNKILSRETKDNFVELYSLSGLLVEIWYTINKSTITKVKITSEDKVVKHYSNLNDLIRNEIKS